MKADFRDRIRAQLRKQGMSISELARRAGMPRSQIGNLLRSKNPRPKNPTLVTLRRIAEALGCEIQEIIEREDRSFAVSEPIHSEEICFKALGMDERYRAVIGLHNWLRSTDRSAEMDRLVMNILRFGKSTSTDRSPLGENPGGKSRCRDERTEAPDRNEGIGEAEPMRVKKTVSILVSSVLVVGPAFADVAPLTPETIEDAITAGKAAKKIDKLYFSGRPLLRGGGGLKSLLSGEPTTSGYYLDIVTPFAILAMESFEAARAYEDFDASDFPIPSPEDQYVAVRVTPKGSAGDEYVIRGVVTVVIDREGEIIKPSDVDTEEHVFANAFGARKESAQGGTYYFPLSVFDPAKGDLNILIVPDSPRAEERWKLTVKVRDLEKLR